MKHFRASVGILLLVASFRVHAQCQPVIYVDPSGSETAPYDTWEKAFGTLHGALAWARGTCAGQIVEIRVSIDEQDNAGSTFQLVPGTSLKGGFDGLDTFGVPNPNPNYRPVEARTGLSGSATHCMSAATGVTNSVVVEQFRISGSAMEGSSGCTGGSDTGGAVFLVNASPKFHRCSFSGDALRAGGGVYLFNSDGSAPTLFSRCVFEKCVAGSLTVTGIGGGLCVARGPVQVVSCVFRWNFVFDGGVFQPVGGAGAFVASDCGGETKAEQFFVNCSFWDNEAEGKGGGLYCNGFDVRIANCTFWQNIGIGGSEIYNDGVLGIANCILAGPTPSTSAAPNVLHLGANGTIDYSCVRDTDILNFGGTGNIDADPMIGGTEDDPFIDQSSPCRNAGNVSYLLEDVADLDGDSIINEPTPLDIGERARISPFGGGAIDIGAAEVPQAWLCYVDCDGSGAVSANDFQCFLNAFAAGDQYADCDQSGGLTANDCQCFLNAYSSGCP